MIPSISDPEIEDARRVLEDHRVKELNRQTALESLVFAIGSQATPFEMATKIVLTLRELAYDGEPGARSKYTPVDKLTDPGLVQRAMKQAGWRFWNQGRTDTAIKYFSQQEGPWWEEITNADVSVRSKYVDQIKWLADKTFSFWSIILGGNNLLAIDTHIARGLAGLGVKVPEAYFTPQSRNSGDRDYRHIAAQEGAFVDTRSGQTQFLEHVGGTPAQRVRRTPGVDYEGIEGMARDFFAKDQRFVVNGRVDFALVDAHLWWKGAGSLRKIYEKIDRIREATLFGDEEPVITFPILSPYSAMVA